LEALLSSSLSAVGFNDSTTWQHLACLEHWNITLEVSLVGDLALSDSIAVGLVALLDSGAECRSSDASRQLELTSKIQLGLTALEWTIKINSSASTK